MIWANQRACTKHRFENSSYFCSKGTFPRNFTFWTKAIRNKIYRVRLKSDLWQYWSYIGRLFDRSERYWHSDQTSDLTFWPFDLYIDVTFNYLAFNCRLTASFWSWKVKTIRQCSSLVTSSTSNKTAQNDKWFTKWIIKLWICILNKQ